MKYVTFNIAIKLKYAGYPQIGLDRYNSQGDLFHNVSSADCYGPVAPTYIEALRWLVDEKNIELSETNRRYIISLVNNILELLNE